MRREGGREATRADPSSLLPPNLGGKVAGGGRRRGAGVASFLDFCPAASVCHLERSRQPLPTEEGPG